MAASIRASTPPPPSTIRTPTTPRFGLDDDYQPYSPRKSTRISQRSREAKTPPPQSHSLRNTRSPRSSKKTPPSNLTMSPSSPQTASKKRAGRPSMADMEARRVSGALTYDSTTSAAELLGLPTPKKGSKAEHRSATAVRNNGMLPTPAKTPVKRPSEIAPAVTGVSRTLFATHPDDDEIMPSPKKKGRKKYAGISLNSFEVEEDSTPIQIFTDSNDRVPEVDNSLENPFYGEGSMVASEPTKRSSKRRKITISGEGEQTVEELERREDGLVYVFRGKKIFRKFTDEVGEDSEGHDGDDAGIEAQLAQSVPSNLRRPLTRSSIKPRLLFPTAQQVTDKEIKSHNTEDEEADTDIEDMNVLTPAPDVTLTPKAPKFAPVSPPTTVRATRSKRVEMDSSAGEPTSDDDAMVTSPMQRKSSGKVSPFSQWQRVKESKPAKGAKKREGEPITRRGEKRART